MSRIKLCILTICISTTVFAESNIPQLINYQGKLTDVNGTALATGDYELTFNIYDAPINGSLIWGPLIFDGATTPGHGGKVPVLQGHFNVILGPIDASATNRPITQAFDTGSSYIQITVDDGINGPITINPRQQILSNPYTFRAINADHAVTADVLNNGVVSNVNGKISIQAPVTATTSGETNQTALKIKQL